VAWRQTRKGIGALALSRGGNMALTLAYGVTKRGGLAATPPESGGKQRG
jgi:hypothetical protein